MYFIDKKLRPKTNSNRRVHNVSDSSSKYSHGVEYINTDLSASDVSISRNDSNSNKIRFKEVKKHILAKEKPTVRRCEVLKYMFLCPRSKICNSKYNFYDEFCLRWTNEL